VFGLIPLQAISGVLLWSAEQRPQFINFFGGITVISSVHTLSAWLFVSFLLMHIYLTTTGHTVTANIKAMVTGWEEVEVSNRTKGRT
jgi:thiosulfate reductase cytochrome b subunit